MSPETSDGLRLLKTAVTSATRYLWSVVEIAITLWIFSIRCVLAGTASIRSAGTSTRAGLVMKSRKSTIAVYDLADCGPNHQFAVRTYDGGTAIVHNCVVQGTGACLMRYAARNLRRRGMDAVMRVHDEVVIEGLDSFEAFNTFKATMLEVPPWAEGLHLNGSGWTAKRYAKS